MELTIYSFLWEWASVCDEPLGTWQTIACIPKDNLNGVRSTLIPNQLGVEANGGWRFVVPHHEEAPISLCPQLIDQINVDLTPFKLSFGMKAIVCFAQRGLLQTDANSDKKE